MEQVSGKFKEDSMYSWWEAQHKAGMTDSHQVDQLRKANEGKLERLQEYKLPVFQTTGTCASLDEALAKIPEDKWDSEKFLVRCSSKNTNTNPKIERSKNISLDQVVDFVKRLTGGEKNYNVEIREFWNADYGGTVIADGEGKIVIETAEGNLSDLESKEVGEIKKAEYNYTQGPSFKYVGAPSTREKDIMLGALKYFTPELDRKALDKLKVYSEYAYSEKRGYRFFEASDQEYWTQLDARKLPNEKSGD